MPLIENAPKKKSFKPKRKRPWDNPENAETTNESKSVKKVASKTTAKIKQKPMSNIDRNYNNSITDNESKPISNIDQTYTKPETADEPKSMSEPEQTYNNSISDNESKPISNIEQTHTEPITANEPKSMSELEQTYTNSITGSESKPVLNIEQTHTKPITTDVPKPMSEPEQTHNNSISDNESKPISNIEQTHTEPITANEPKSMSELEQTYTNSITGSESKPVLNIEQTHTKPITTDVPKPMSKLKQTYTNSITGSESKPVSNIERPHNRSITNTEQTYNKSAINLQHSYNKSMLDPVTNIELSYNKKINRKSVLHRLSNLQKNTLFIIFKKCVENQSIVTPEIPTELFTSNLHSSYGSIKTTITRLKKLGLLTLVDYKAGRGGWSVYKLDESIYKEINTHLELFPVANLKQTFNKPILETVTTPPSSSISFNNINKELTTNEYPFNPADVPGQQQLGPQFDSDWQTIDITPLASIGFSNNHLSQLFTKNELTPKQVQESINAFAFDLEENKRGEKIKTSPLNLFMGILKGGSPYNPPKNYESDEDRLLREQVEAEREKLEKRQQMQYELKELKYQNWLLDLSIEKKLEILDVPQAFFEKMPIEAIQEGLKKHFEMKVL